MTGDINPLDRAIALIRSGEIVAARDLLLVAVTQGRADAETRRQLAKILFHLGDVDGALRQMSTALEERADLPEAVYELGVMYLAAGRFDDAVRTFRSVPEQARAPDLLYNLAFALRSAGRPAEALTVYRQLATVAPGHARGLYNMANLLVLEGNPAEAVEVYRRVLALVPEDVGACTNLAVALVKIGQAAEAEQVLRRGLARAPENSALLDGLAAALFAQGKSAAALEAAWAAAGRAPDALEVQCTLASILRETGQPRRAQQVLAPAIGRHPQPSPEALNLLAAILISLSLPSEARPLLERALTTRPDWAEALNNLGMCWAMEGHGAAAVAAFRRAHQVEPGNPTIHSNLLFALLHSSDSPEEVAAEHRRFGEIQEELAGPPLPLPPPRPVAGRRLRLGYVSPDFCIHAVSTLFEPVLAAHDRARFEIFCYHTRHREDDATARMKRMADHWRNITHLSPAEAADVIRGDAIDVLIDLAGHSAGNGLPIFARKPAHVQATWLGYPGTTGLSRVDYRLGTTGKLPGVPDPYGTERLLGLTREPVFHPPENGPGIQPPPCLGTGMVTFGAVNRRVKASDAVLRVWKRLLDEVPNSRLLLIGDGADTLDVCLAAGFAADRLIVERRRPLEEFLDLLNQIDIALDPFPYGGGTTGLFTLWMGVPVVTLVSAGQRGMTSAVVLRSLGLNDLVTSNEDAYVRTARWLAEDRERLAELRASLRAMLQASPVMRPDGLVRTLEAVLLEAWELYLASSPASS